MASSTVSRGESLSCTNPKLDIETKQGSPGAHINVYSLEYIIWDTSSGSDIQVHPPSGRATADVDNDCPTGNRLSTGHYVADWDIPVDEALGEHRIDWFVKRIAASTELAFPFCFSVLPEVAGLFATTYASVTDIRDAGITVAQADNDRVEFLLDLASRKVDEYTGRVFVPASKTLLIDGTGGRAVLLEEPIISIEELRLVNDPFSSNPDGDLVDTDLYKVYNRHLTQNLRIPDDRDNPRVEFIHGNDVAGRDFVAPRNGLLTPSYFPRGVQNVSLKGVFGYTDYDGGAVGVTPSLIRHLTILLTVQMVPKAGDTDARLRRILRNELKRERTRDQEYETHSPGDIPRASIWFTGDPEMDAILTRFKRPIMIGSA